MQAEREAAREECEAARKAWLRDPTGPNTDRYQDAVEVYNTLTRYRIVPKNGLWLIFDNEEQRWPIMSLPCRSEAERWIRRRLPKRLRETST